MTGNVIDGEHRFRRRPRQPARSIDRKEKVATAIVHARRQHDAGMARRRWTRGEVVPARITAALDLRGLHGPDVDAACLASEPDVDQWEVGDLYPSWDQLCALADLTGFRPVWFTTPGWPWETPNGGSIDIHFPEVDSPADPVLTFSASALEAAAEMGVRP